MGQLSSILRKVSKGKRFNSAVILAAGSGKRFSDDTAKQFALVDGTSVLVRSAKAFNESDCIDEIVVVTRSQDKDGVYNILKDNGITKLTTVVSGGDTRQDSSRLGFEAVNPECSFVAIHDAARCLVTSDMINAAFEAAYTNGAAACASRSTDTIKITDGSDTVKETVDRENAWVVQTPQVFLSDIYRAAAYNALKSGFVGTDDCSLCENVGFKVKMVECGKYNIKITYPEDIAVAEALLRFRKEKGKNK